MGYRSLPQLFLAQAEKYHSRKFLSRKKDGRYRALSWDEVRNDVMACRSALRKAGIGTGDAVALLSENRPEWVTADLAILASGAANVPIYATSTGAETAYILKHCGARIIFLSTREQAEKVGAVRHQCPDLEHVICFDLPKDEGSELSFSAFLDDAREDSDPAEFRAAVENIRAEDTASIIYTSGTTGPPKGVVLTHANFLSNCEACRPVIPVGPDDETLSFLPLSHVFERMAGYYYVILNGGAIHYAENMECVPGNLMEVRPTVACSVPRLFEKIYNRIMEQAASAPPLRRKIFFWSKDVLFDAAGRERSRTCIPPLLSIKRALAVALVAKKIRKKLGGRLRFFISGGAPLSREIGEFFHAFGILIVEGYGLTETSPVAACNSPAAYKFGTVGRAIPGVDIKIAPDGEILVRGPNVMKGYYRNEDATREVIRDGWFSTGDIGSIDKDGFLSITGRKKDIIVTSGGKNVSPQNIEQLLASDPLIGQVCICGDGRKFLTALIVPNWEAVFALAEQQGWKGKFKEVLAEDEAVISFFRARIDQLMLSFPSYSRIKYFTLLANEFSQPTGEMTPTLKIKRNIIARKYAQVIDRMYGAS